jgi:vacuolar-type H+-ATPase subunit F/Vma7
MGQIVAIGEHERMRGFALAGVEVLGAEDPVGARRAWAALPGDVSLVILSAAAHRALAADDLDRGGLPLWVVLPQ